MAAVTVNQGIQNQCAIFGQAFSFAIPNDAFTGSNLVYTAELNRINPTFNGSNILPTHLDREFWHMRQLGTWYNWLSLNAGTFSGTPTNDWYHHDTLQVKVRATDSTDGQYAEEVFIITMHDYVAGVTPTPMAKTEAQCAHVITVDGSATVDSETLNLQPGDTIGIRAGVNVSWVNIKLTSGIPGNPIYLTNVGGKARINAISGTRTLYIQGQDYMVIGQGVVGDPYGIEISGLTNPGVQVIESYQNIEFAFLNVHSTGFAGFSIKNTDKQRPMLTKEKLVKYFDGTLLRDPASEVEMNAITAEMNGIASLENHYCVRADIKAVSSIDPAYVKYLYRAGQWIINYHADMHNITYVGRMTSAQRDALVSPSIGDYVYCTDLRLYYIYNACYDWVAYYDMININVHDCWGYEIGTKNGTVLPENSAGEMIYVGTGFWENNQPEEGFRSQYFPNGPHSIRKFRARNLYADGCGYDAYQFKNMPYKDNYIHRSYVKNYGRGTFAPADNIGIQDEAYNIGEGFSGYVAYTIAETCGEVSPVGYQNYSSENALFAFNVVQNTSNNGRVPIYARRHGLLEGVDPAGVYNNAFFNTFIKFNGRGEDPTGTQYDDLIDIISRAGIREFANNIFAEIDPFVTKIAGTTLNQRNQIYSGEFEDVANGNYHPTGAEALNGYDLRTKDWGPLQNGVNGNGDPIVYDIYGNTVDWDNLKVGAAQASPVEELPTLQHYPNAPEPRFVTYDTGFDTGKWMIVYYPREYYQNRGKKFPIFFQTGGDGEEYGAGGQAGAEAEAFSFGYLKNLNNDQNLDYEFIVVCPVVAYSWGATSQANYKTYLQSFIASNPRIDRQRLYYGGLSASAVIPMFNLCNINYQGCAVVAMAPYYNVGVDYTMVQNAHYWGVKDSADGGGNVVSQRDAILALPGRTAEAKATVYETMVGVNVHGAWVICYDETKVPTLTGGITNNSPINTTPENTVREWVLSKVRTDLPVGPPVPIQDVFVTALLNRINVSFINICQDATGFKIYRKENAGAYQLMDSITGSSYADYQGFNTGSTYTYKIVSYNGDGDSIDSPEVSVVYTGENTLFDPIAVAGANQTITLPTNQITLDGSGSSDSDGTIVSYAWTKVSGGAATITSPTSASTTVTGLVAGTYVFRLTVTDNDGLTDTDDVSVTVNAIALPSHTGTTWDASDLAYWRTTNKYKVAGDAFTNSPAAYTEIVARADAFVADPATDYITGDPGIEIGEGGVYVGLKGNGLMSAAFVYLLTGDTTYGNAAKAGMIAQCNNTAVNWGTIEPGDTFGNNIFVGHWMIRLFNAFEYVKPLFSAGELSTIETWFDGGADWCRDTVNSYLAINLPNRLSRDYSVRIGTAVSTSTTRAGNKDPLSGTGEAYAWVDDQGGFHNIIMEAHARYCNRTSALTQAFGLWAIYRNDATMIDHAKLYLEEWLKFGVYSDGSQSEWNRNGENNNGRAGLGTMYYGTINIECAMVLSDAMRRKGDNSWYEYTTSDGLDFDNVYGQYGSSGGNKNLKLVIDTYVECITQEVNRYWKEVLPANLIDPLQANGTQYPFDLIIGLANQYYRVAKWKEVYMRTYPGVTQYNEGTFSSAAGNAWVSGGPIATFPGFNFMYNEREVFSIAGRSRKSLLF